MTDAEECIELAAIAELHAEAFRREAKLRRAQAVRSTQDAEQDARDTKEREQKDAEYEARMRKYDSDAVETEEKRVQIEEWLREVMAIREANSVAIPIPKFMQS